MWRGGGAIRERNPKRGRRARDRHFPAVRARCKKLVPSAEADSVSSALLSRRSGRVCEFVPYTFKFLRDACPCALCEDERGKSGRKPGEAEKLAPGALPMFKPAAKALTAEAVGKYALRFSFNDNHDLGIYSWAYLREVCPCDECRKAKSRQ